jgi:hypothetical protein
VASALVIPRTIPVNSSAEPKAEAPNAVWILTFPYIYIFMMMMAEEQLIFQQLNGQYVSYETYA